MTTLLAKRVTAARTVAGPEAVGMVRRVVGLAVEVVGVPAAVGDVIMLGQGADAVPAEVIALDAEALRCMPLAHADGLRVGTPARTTGGPLRIEVGDGLLGRVIDGLGRPIDDGGPIQRAVRVPISGEPPHALQRQRVNTPVGTGVRVLDTLVPLGRGQRIGLFAGSGVGKSSLLSMIARGTDAAISVIALVGERGREVREFIEDDLGPEGLARSVVVVATSDEPALVRLRAALVATRIAEHFRDLGQDVVLMMDSLTRVATAQREIGLSAGEPPATRGYPPSVFALLPRLLERAGSGAEGSVTGIYTVLVDGDDHNEPIADAARSILDGHVVLDRRLATAGHYPAVDVLGSVSRVDRQITDAEQRRRATVLRRLLAARRNAQDLVDVGAYVPGSNVWVDAALENAEAIDSFLCQDVGTPVDRAAAWAQLSAVVAATGRDQ